MGKFRAKGEERVSEGARNQSGQANPTQLLSKRATRETSMGLIAGVSSRYLLLASLEYSNTTVSSHMVQILVVLAFGPASTARDSDDARHVLGGARVE
jgi:hypothetical protein